MLFNSFAFAVFFPAVTAVYFLAAPIPLGMLLVASCYFYMAFIPVYILDPVRSRSSIDYVAGILIEAAEGGGGRLLLIVSIVANVGVLAVFKYFNFLEREHSTAIAGSAFGWPLPIPAARDHPARSASRSTRSSR